MFERSCEIIKALRRMDKPDMAYGYDGAYKWNAERIGPDAANLIESMKSELEQLQELAKAKTEGRLVVLPCKVGDTIWKIKAVFSYFSKPMEDRVERIIISSNEILVCCTSGTKFSVNSIGKTVFLTKEAAEKALGAGE